jgi:hypothetical protein
MEVEEDDKELEDYQKSRKNRIITSSCSICCQLSFMIATIVVLLVDSSSCHYPIRAWLIVYIALASAGTLTSLFLELVIHKRHLKKQLIQKLYTLHYVILVLFFLTWTILGSVWVYKDDHCKKGKKYSEFRIGWDLIVAILAVNYLAFIFCAFGGCVGVVYVISLNYLKRVKTINKLNEEARVINSK